MHKRTEARDDKNAMYQTKYWKALRQRQLSTQPLCQACMSVGIITPANHVDHVFPWTHINKEAFYLNLFQSLCLECHSHKTSLEQQGEYRHYIDGSYRVFSKNDYQYIIRENEGHLAGFSE